MNFLKIFNKKKDDDSLIYLQEHTQYNTYETTNYVKNTSLEKILKYFRKMVEIERYCGVTIESKFNEVYYPFFDLDTEDKMELFKTLYEDTSYTLFISSINNEDGNVKYRYWGFIDTPHKKLNDIFSLPNWKICNDEKYVKFSCASKKLVFRGLYKDKSRQPQIHKKHGDFSSNFELFMSKIENYYNNAGLELSTLRYHDDELLIKFNRKNKLKKLGEL